jgi:molecular chaperone GrpE
MDPYTDSIVPTPNEAEKSAEPTAEEALAAKTQELERLRERLLRLQAEFENYKKRVAREKAEFLKFANESLILEFLPILDNLERALAAARAEVGTTPLVEGIEMIARLFAAALEKSGVKPIGALGQPFDPSLHQAVAQVDVDHGSENLVVEEVRKGYLLEGRAIRPAMVKVSRVPSSGGDGETAEGPSA